MRIGTSCLRAARRARREKKGRSIVFKGLSDPFFPVTFFLRNLAALSRESGWNSRSPRIKRRLLSRMLAERCAFFLEVKQWAGRNGSHRSTAAWQKDEKCNAGNPSQYCTHCGGCCEIAGGLAEFSSSTPFPHSWMVIFGDGLGKGHRFCPFLWELGGSGFSLCAIHHWRPNPCRQFEKDECDFLLHDPDFIGLSHPQSLRKVFRLFRFASLR